MVIFELADEIVAVEVNRGIDDRALAVMGLKAVEETLHLGANDTRCRARLAGRRGGFHSTSRTGGRVTASFGTLLMNQSACASAVEQK